MPRIALGYRSVFFIYCCALVVLGAYLLLSSPFLFNYNTPSKLPLDFLLRFGIFWFVSFVLALVFFLAHLKANEYAFSAAEVAQSSRIGAALFMAGVSVALVSGVVLYLLG